MVSFRGALEKAEWIPYIGFPLVLRRLESEGKYIRLSHNPDGNLTQEELESNDIIIPRNRDGSPPALEDFRKHPYLADLSRKAAYHATWTVALFAAPALVIGGYTLYNLVTK
jgi:hypothetical protein